MNKDLMFLLIMTAVNIPLFCLFIKVLFGGWAGFKEAVIFLFQPDFISMIFDEGYEDLWAEAKLAFFFFACFFIVLGELLLITKLFY